MKGLGLSLCVLLWGFAALADDVWVPPKGTLHLTFSFTGAVWDEFLQSGTSSVPLPGEISQYELVTTAEYVPIENLSFDLTFPIVVSNRKFSYVVTDPSGQIIAPGTGTNGEIRDVDSNVGIGDVTLGGKYILWDEVASLGARMWGKFPGSYDAGYVVNAPGDGQFDLGLGFLAGFNIPSIRMYARGSLAYVLRVGEPNDQLELTLEPGVSITKDLSARLFYRYVNQFGGDDILVYNADVFYPAVHEDSHQLGAGVSYRASEKVGFFTVFQATLAGRNTADTMALTFGVDLAF